MNWSVVRVITGRRGVSSERRRSSCSSYVSLSFFTQPTHIHSLLTDSSIHTFIHSICLTLFTQPTHALYLQIDYLPSNPRDLSPKWSSPTWPTGAMTTNWTRLGTVFVVVGFQVFLFALGTTQRYENVPVEGILITGFILYLFVFILMVFIHFGGFESTKIPNIIVTVTSFLAGRILFYRGDLGAVSK